MNTFRAIFRISAIIGLFSLNTTAEICEAVIETCPEDIEGDTITLPERVIALSSKIKVCEPTDVKEEILTDPPSIFFIIDHSSSMNTSQQRDTAGVRFDVTTALLDSINKRFPRAEVGASVFNEKLFFNEADNPEYYDMFQTLPLPGYPETNQGAYVPLTKLNETIEVTEEDTVLGIDALQYILRTEQAERDETEFRDLVIEPPDRAYRGTNINTAMASARAAFQESETPVENQYVVFISDGVATTTFEDGELLDIVGGVETRINDPRDAYVAGEGLPTTFTVFFTDEGVEEAPEALYDFTANIRENGYSENNENSEIWSINANYDTLMTLLSSNVMNTILQTYRFKPLSVSVNNSVSTEYTGDFFLFEEKFGLNDDLTPLNYNIHYNKTNSLTNDTLEVTRDIHFYIRRSAGAEVPNEVTLYCWDEPELEILYQGQSVSVVRDYMDTLEVGITPSTSEYYEYPDSFEVSITNLPGENQDSLNLVLYYETNGRWSTEFVRKRGDPEQSDNILQHSAVDSIRAFYRNPEIYLDTTSTSVLYELRTNTAILRFAYYFDNNADGYIDSLYLEVDGEYPEDELIENIDEILTISRERGISIEKGSVRIDPNGNIGLSVTENRSKAPQTNITESDGVAVNDYTFSTTTSKTTFTGAASIVLVDKMAPVVVSGKASYHSDPNTSDSLYVTFSEPMTLGTQTTPFYFNKPDTSPRFNLKLQHLSGAEGSDTSDTHFFEISENQEDKSKRLGQGDSVWINPTMFIYDLHNNRQDNSENRRALLSATVSDEECNLNIHATVVQEIPDFLLSKPGISSEIKSSTKGNIVIVSPEEDFFPGINFSLNGNITIFDLVGNRVISNRPMVFDPELNKLFYVWNGRNKSNRKVEDFAYYGIVNVRINRGEEITKKIMIGLSEAPVKDNTE